MWEPVHGGWLAPSECGWHYVPFSGETTPCATCRLLSRYRLTSEHDHRNHLFYPDGSPA